MGTPPCPGGSPTRVPAGTGHGHRPPPIHQCAGARRGSGASDVLVQLGHPPSIRLSPPWRHGDQLDTTRRPSAHRALARHYGRGGSHSNPLTLGPPHLGPDGRQRIRGHSIPRATLHLSSGQRHPTRRRLQPAQLGQFLRHRPPTGSAVAYLPHIGIPLLRPRIIRALYTVGDMGYADDLVSTASTLAGLQRQADIVSAFAICFDMEISVSKLRLARFGSPLPGQPPAPMAPETLTIHGADWSPHRVDAREPSRC